MNSTIFLYPYKSKKNQYIHFLSNALNQNADLSNFKIRYLLKGKIKKNDTIVLNWFENCIVKKSGNVKLKGIIRLSLLLLACKIIKPNLVWVKHNHQPHYSKKSTMKISKFFMKKLEKSASSIVVHSKSALNGKNFTYIPHPLYPTTALNLKHSNSPKKILIFGAISRYKKVEDLLSIWPKEYALTIAGYATPSYASKLKKIAAAQELKVDFNNNFLSDDELSKVLETHDITIIPHPEKSAIVSGAFFHAKSYGHHIIKRGFEPINNYGDPTCVFNYNSKNQLKLSIEKCMNSKESKQNIYMASRKTNCLNVFSTDFKELIK